MFYIDSKVDIIGKVIDGRIRLNSAVALLSKGRILVSKTLRIAQKGSSGAIQTKNYDVNLQHLAEFLVKKEGTAPFFYDWPVCMNAD